MMYLSRAVPHQEAWKNPQLISQFKSSYAVHQAVWSLFLGDENKTRDFLYRYDMHNGCPVIYIVSEEKPVSQHGLWVVDTKEYNPCISKGDRFYFSVRVNPVVTKSYVDDKTGKEVHKRHDVIMNRKFHNRELGVHESNNEILSDEGFAWLSSRGEKHGFTVSPSSLMVSCYEKRVFEKSTPQGKKREVVLGTLDMEGVLEVTDAEVFCQMLFAGLGPAKGFGCGLMLIKRV